MSLAVNSTTKNLKWLQSDRYKQPSEGQGPSLATAQLGCNNNINYKSVKHLFLILNHIHHNLGISETTQEKPSLSKSTSEVQQEEPMKFGKHTMLLT